MVKLYNLGSAEIIDGISVDYIYVEEEYVTSLLSVGWKKDPKELQE